MLGTRFSDILRKRERERERERERGREGERERGREGEGDPQERKADDIHVIPSLLHKKSKKHKKKFKLQLIRFNCNLTFCVKRVNCVYSIKGRLNYN